MIIKLVRHAESLANIGAVLPHEAGDAKIGLSDAGRQQALQAGQLLGHDFVSNALVYCSPYQRTRDTLQAILQGANLQQPKKTYEDPRLREVERGYQEEGAQFELRKIHGWFYYRHAGGESPADVYDRISSFLESMMRQVQRKEAEQVMIVTHGMVIRCFVMRFLHLTVEQFESLENPDNCDVITIAHKEHIQDPLFSCGRWAVAGMRLRN
ncbi:histidine phosphatase family protein [Paucimonas lemoignei]|nr:histidine phosphatase family protein [Paucimonas lemoignei]